METFFKRLLVFVIAVISAVYIVSPVDFMPGVPADDILVLVASVAECGKLRKEIAEEG